MSTIYQLFIFKLVVLTIRAYFSNSNSISILGIDSNRVRISVPTLEIGS